MTEKPSNNSQKIAKVERNEKGQLLPGSVLNPKGKEKGTKHMSTSLNELIMEKIPNDPEERTYKQMLLRRILSKAIEKVDPTLVNIVFDRLEGKPDQGIDITSNGETVGGTMTDQEIEIMAAELSERLKKKKTGIID